jgi:predicted RNA-binding protein associated with RNAse of E/G family
MHRDARKPPAPAHVSAHPPKVETFDIVERTNVDPKGFVRQVEHYRVEPWGLYMARTADHDKFHYLESWLIPSLGIRATIFHFYPYHARDQDHYIDIGRFTAGERVWTSVDHYLDIVVRTGRGVELLDVDELFAATAAGLLDHPTATEAVERAVSVIDGIASAGYSLEDWLAKKGMAITWR